MNDLSFVTEVWDVLRSHIDFNERSDAAEALVTLLIENNFEPEEIKDEFRGDKDISTALKYYIDQHDTEDEYEEEDDDVDHDEWD